MPRLPERHSLVSQTALVLKESISDEAWEGWLPEERDLCKSLQVSRSTLRKALHHLRDEGVIETQHGVGTRIVLTKSKGTRRHSSTTVGVLLPESLNNYRHFVTFLIDDLRTLLIDHGLRLVVHEYNEAAPARMINSLARLVGHHHHACWTLMGCGREMQMWFSHNRIPAVVSGTCHPESGLPFVCLDNRALGRHAAGTILRFGHRHLALILSRSNPGLKSGLEDIFNRQPQLKISTVMIGLEEPPDPIINAVDRLLRLPVQPSLFFVAESKFYLSVFSRLSQKGLRVPGDVSLLCRDDEPFLTSMVPTPARYSKNPHTYAKQLYNQIIKTIDHEAAGPPSVHIMPRFILGGSLAKLELR